MASPTRWTWVWVHSGSWWWTGRPGMLQFMGLQRVGHDWVTELNWAELKSLVNINLVPQLGKDPGQCFRLQFCGSPLIIPGCKHIIISLCAEFISGFTLTFLQCCLFYLVSHNILLNLKQLARILEWFAMPAFRNLPNPEIEHASLLSPALAGGFFTTSTTWYKILSTEIKMHNLKVENCVLFGRQSWGHKPRRQPLRCSEGLLQRDKGGARIYEGICNKNQVVGTSNYYDN